MKKGIDGKIKPKGMVLLYKQNDLLQINGSDNFYSHS